MMSQIRPLLLADNALMAVVNDVVPSPSERLDNIILFETAPIDNDGCTQRVRIKLTAICDTEAQAAIIYERICAVLITPSDRPLTGDILRVGINGGGSLYDEARKKYHKITYLIITARS